VAVQNSAVPAIDRSKEIHTYYISDYCTVKS